MKLLKQYEHLLPYSTIIVFLLTISAVLVLFDRQADQLTYQIHRKLVHSVHDEMKSIYVEKMENELKSRTMEAIDKIKHLYGSGSTFPDENAKEEAKEILTNLRYKSEYDNEEGYFFVYDLNDGKNIVHPIKKEWVGQNKWDYEDKNGKYVIRDLITTALNNRENGGFDVYAFHKPSRNTDIGDLGRSKLSYVVVLGDSWVLGTGIYLDSVDKFLGDIDTSILKYIHDSEKMIISITLLGLLILGFLQIRIGKAITYSNISRKLHLKVKQDLGYVAKNLDRKLAQLDQTGTKVAMLDQDFLKEQNETIYTVFDNFIAILEDKDPDNPGVVDGLKDIKTEFEKRERIPIVFTHSNEITVQSDCLSKAKKLALLNVAKESLNNIRHAAATQVDIELQSDNCNITLIIHDNGSGFDIDGGHRINGLYDMNTSMREVGGSFRIISSPGKGTTITATVPKSHTIWSYITCLLKRP